MSQPTARLLVVTATAALTIATPSAPATAAEPGRDFGHHVHICAQTEAFSAAHNPGHHHGFTGWSPDHPC